MADKYCKKSSLEAVADEIRVRAGESSSTKYTFPGGFETAISGLLIPTQRGAPSKELKTNDTSYTIQKGIYTGGSVSVDPIEWPTTIQPSSSQQTIKDNTNNKPLKKVVVDSVDLRPFSYGLWRGTAAWPSSITISGLPFQPVGILFLNAYGTNAGSDSRYVINGLFKIGNTIGGHAQSYTSSATYRFAPITSANIQFGSNSVTISNVVCNDPEKGSNSCKFNSQYANSSSNRLHVYYVWG